MQEIQVSDAKIRISHLMDQVELGETLIITRHGRRIARIVPELGQPHVEIDNALAGVREPGGRSGRITVGELLAADDEGRRADGGQEA